MGKTKKKDWTRTKDYRQLNADLLQGLSDAGMDNARYKDLVDEYMVCWVQLQELNEDIRERGTRVEYKNGSQTGLTENKSLGTKIRLLKAMDDIFRRLGFTEEAKAKRAAAAKDLGGDEDDEL